MKSEAEKMAKMIKRNANKKPNESLVVGKVVRLAPLTVSDGSEILLDDELIVTYTVRQLITSAELKVGNRVAMVSDGQNYLVIDKVVQ